MFIKFEKLKLYVYIVCGLKYIVFFIFGEIDLDVKNELYDV